MMNIEGALTAALLERGHSVIIEYDLFLMMHKLFRTREFKGEKVNIRQENPTIRRLREAIKKMSDSGILMDDPDFGRGVYAIIGVPEQNAEELCCIVDPFCYMSHLSAMQRYSLTNRYAVELNLTSPHRTLWSSMRNEKIATDYGKNVADGEVMTLRRASFSPLIRGRAVVRHESKHPGSWRQMRGFQARIATVGQTFVDTVDQPQWCGGMAHVLDVWKEHAETYFEDIVTAIDAASTKLAKVRAGYILQERLELGCEDSRVNGWKAFAQRGGSQVLDPERGYEPRFSETWMLSLNAEA
jgi:predicted transcriptional regulator of viral defense system